MSLWHRAPREVYRVYGEDQYLEGETAPAGQMAPAEETASPAGLHAGRLIGVGLLVGVGLATLALVFLNLSHPRRAPDLVGQGARVQTGKRVAPAPDPAQRVRRVWLPARPASHKAVPPVPAIHRRAPLPLRSPAPEPLEPRAQAAVVSPTPVAAELSVQEDFGFEQ
jgi:hypothetical protein